MCTIFVEMAVAGAPETIAQIMELEEDEIIPYDTAVRVTSVLNLVRCRADHFNCDPRAVKLSHLAVQDVADVPEDKRIRVPS